ncbi:hypothetical protein AGDE_11335 [Angomonas deanei]|nr:hypothetical protein AGDE_11335 [Angomonas deanei]|eukprot:EPY26427.1 hypothetical protein AGDE_11335 [Angomonas deanei]
MDFKVLPRLSLQRRGEPTGGLHIHTDIGLVSVVVDQIHNGYESCPTQHALPQRNVHATARANGVSVNQAA